MSKKTSYSYVGIALVILVFGIIFIPKIVDRVSGGDITRDESRSKDVSTLKQNEIEKSTKSDLEYIPNIDGGKKRSLTLVLQINLG